MQNFLIIVTAVLLPIIPAYLLYKALPSRSTVSGPFKGLSIQLKGAFGGYFLVVLVIFGYFMWAQESQPPPGLYELWEVKGAITFPNGRAPAAQSDTQFHLYPPDQPFPDWTFTLHLPILRNAVKFPTFAIEIPGYDTYTVHLDPTERGAYGSFPYRLTYDKQHKVIDVEEIVMKARASARLAPAPNRGPVTK